MVIQPLDTADNKTIRQIKRLIASRTARKKSQETVIEGYRLIEEALAAGVTPRVVVYSPKWVERAEGRSFLIRLQALSIHLFYVTDRLFDEITQVETPPGLLAVVPVPEPLPLQRVLERTDYPLLLPVAVGIQDPGNLGTLMRASLASGAASMAMGPNTVEAFNPKAIRASAGAVFRLPLVELTSPDMARLREAGVGVKAATVSGGTPYYDVDWSAPTVLLLGNEGNGLDESWLAQAQTVTIPMSWAADSLNVSLAGAVILFHAAYVRHKAGLGFAPPVML
ncbi:MAG: RNA methyltransferase [Sulfobacillus acidophilus]|uniref:RNA methyltransferase n=1 Tax=Sulfobacillus acidophilus TaxID=53633 RepID=A0A2T2WIT3_9FIRM|nr:MAG: RNA methyltransferase [Sulfobacillus acidophilus]